MGGAAGTGVASRTPFVRQQEAVRSGFNRPAFSGVAGQGGFRSTGQPSSGWQRFGEPNRGAEGFAPRANPGAGWSRFGSPQPAPQTRPAVPPAFQGRSSEGRGNYSAPPSYNAPRAAPNNGGGFRSAPQYRGSGNAPAFRGGGGGGGGFHGGGGGAARGGGGGGGHAGGGGGHGRR
jgi:translation initiation factor IF-2